MNKLKKKMACGLVVCMIALGGLAMLQCSNQTADVGYFITKSVAGTTEVGAAGAIVGGAAGKLGAVLLASEEGAEVGSVAGPVGILAGFAIGAL